jgi:putative tricarboxylic transport membrane protein
MLTTDRVAGAALTLLALGVLWESRKLPLGSLSRPGPAFMPVVLAVVLLAFGLALAATGGGAVKLAAVRWSEWRHVVAIFAVCAFAALALERLGYRATVAVALAFMLGVVEKRGVVFTVAFVVALAMGSFLLFDTLLRVPLPRGPFGL